MNKFLIPGKDWISIGKGALLALGGAAVAYLASSVLPAIDQSGPIGAVLAGAAAILLNVARKYLAS